jgi:hypothetical protein
LNIIEAYATKFAIDPDVVYGVKTFDTVINFLVAAKERREYEKRYAAVEKMMQPPKQ